MMTLKTPPINPKIIAALPALLSVSIAALGIQYFQLTAITIPLVLGIIAGGLVDLDNRLTGRIKNIFFTLLAFAVSSLSIQFTLDHSVLLLITFPLLAFIFTLSGAVGLRYRTIAFGTVAVAIYTALTHRDDSVSWFINPLMILLGTSLYSVVTLLIHLLFPHRPVQESIATAYQALSAYLTEKSGFFNPDEAEHLEQRQIALAMKNNQVITAFNQCRTALFYRMSGQHRHPRTAKMLRYYFTAQDIHERASSSHVQYQEIAEQLKNSDLIFRFLRLMELQGQACRDLANSLREGKSYVYDERLTRASKGLRQSITFYTAQHHADGNTHLLQRLAANLRSVNQQLLHLEHQHDEDEERNQDDERIMLHESSRFRDAIKSMVNHLTVSSATFRHAVRMAILSFACVLIVQLSQMEFGYWILLTALFVCQPNYSATQIKLKQRVIGTLAGVLVGSILPFFTPTLETKLVILVISTTLFFFFRAKKYSYSTFFITIQAMLSFSIAGYETASALHIRFIDTIIGAGLAWIAVSYLWPDWHYLNLHQTGNQAISSNAGYLRSIMQQLRDGGHNKHVNYRLARRQSHERAASLSSTLSDMSGEPEKYGNRLQDGFKLLKINYSLISYISALGAYRDQMHHEADEQQFINHYFDLMEHLCTLLEQLGTLEPSVFAQQHANLTEQMDALRHFSQSDQSQFLWQQLHMIERLLEPAYQALHGDSMPSAITTTG